MWARSITVCGLAIITMSLMSSDPKASGSPAARATEDKDSTQDDVGSIAGTVLDARTGRATRRALVSIPDQGPSFDVFADQNGNFLIRNVPEGQHRVLARMMGYLDLAVDSVSVRQATVTGLLFQLIETGEGLPITPTYTDGSPKTGSLLGRVYSKAAGHPLPYARVMLREIMLRAFTGRDGTFRIDDVPAEEYTVNVRRYGYENQSWKYIYVRPDSTTDVEFGMFESDDPAGRIAGTVVDIFAGEPVTDASVFIETLNLGAWTDSSGTYTIEDLPPGHYTVRVEADHFEPRTRCSIVVHADSTSDLGFRLFFVPPTRE